MSSPITEIIVFPASDALKSDPSIFAEFTQVLAKKTSAGGMLEQAWGFRDEEPDTWQGFINWISLEHHKKLAPVIETDKEFGEAIGRMVSGPAKVVHVPFAPFDNFKRAIAAPLTEVILTSVKDGADLQEFKDAIEYGLDTAGAAQGCIRGAWGFTVEDEKAAVTVLGWESHEAHDKYIALDAVKERFMKVANVEKLFHVKLQ